MQEDICLLRKSISKDRLKVIDGLKDSEFDYTLTQLSKKFKLSRTYLRKMCDDGIFKITRSDDKSNYYRLDYS